MNEYEALLEDLLNKLNPLPCLHHTHNQVLICSKSWDQSHTFVIRNFHAFTDHQSSLPPAASFEGRLFVTEDLIGTNERQAMGVMEEIQVVMERGRAALLTHLDRKSTRLNSSHWE